ncbi:MAG: hypothetical protein A2600_12380 [Candidatus Lambdaproteobacteria bacterium RIFOXYD1_FULL_56_27]|uniref:RHS repeat-associated core domain-containing protein n=1 Tax=Candidatus Lambdaproteobacteria bacterium RIFOXYD2_FULL_56_26 TaxID=1817773 RepID=A0A1F6H203_9PROT|nr:MAG: hypothetical protein A2426_12500 [Candidatus Lambdaproteobacteria bacterium RIFOXYC1_FULL_56_13]OGH04382.1 MAG: hypothetical protein A2557_11080 [Candidatus Lambdaproteobacteria bacterium RIFOXYD2_FULL_56_26]OGH08165.1 MAG: hypothetical protein A2600_12380 [Candidatus Lambdaproteobacteria bacterium RIFOXYD1_FULL_56_27]
MDNDTGLVYYHFRYYDPSLGRFLTPDNLIPGGGDDPQEYNRYAYVNGNPVKYTDPTGHWKTPGWAKSIADNATKVWHGIIDPIAGAFEGPCVKDPSSCMPEPPPCVKNPSSCIEPIVEKAEDYLAKLGPNLAALLVVPLLAFNQSAVANAKAFLNSKTAAAGLWGQLKGPGTFKFNPSAFSGKIASIHENARQQVKKWYFQTVESGATWALAGLLVAVAGIYGCIQGGWLAEIVSQMVTKIGCKSLAVITGYYTMYWGQYRYNKKIEGKETGPHTASEAHEYAMNKVLSMYGDLNKAITEFFDRWNPDNGKDKSNNGNEGNTGTG